MDSLKRRLRRYAIVWLDVLAYVLTVAVAATLVALAVGIASGGGFLRGKALLFVIGWVVIAYATIRLWPTSPEDLDADGRSVPGDVASSRLQRLARALPPVRWIEQPAVDDRVSPEGKLFLAGCGVLVTSFLLETQFGIA